MVLIVFDWFYSVCLCLNVFVVFVCFCLFLIVLIVFDCFDCVDSCWWVRAFRCFLLFRMTPGRRGTPGRRAPGGGDAS